MKKLTMLILSLAVAASACFFAACQNNDPTKEQDPTTATEVPTEKQPESQTEEQVTIPAESDDNLVIEPVTLKTEPVEDITEDVGDIDDLTEDEPEIPEENDQEAIGEPVDIPEESVTEPPMD